MPSFAPSLPQRARREVLLSFPHACRPRRPFPLSYGTFLHLQSRSWHQHLSIDAATASLAIAAGIMCRYRYVYYSTCQHAEFYRLSYCDKALGLPQRYACIHPNIASQLTTRQRRSLPARHWHRQYPRRQARPRFSIRRCVLSPAFHWNCE